MQQYLDYVWCKETNTYNFNRFVIDSYRNFIWGTGVREVEGGLLVPGPDSGVSRLIRDFPAMELLGEDGVMHRVRLVMPMLSFPEESLRECRMRGLSYLVRIKVHLEVDGVVESRLVSDLVDVPLMVGMERGKMEKYDDCGYFMVKGLEYALINMERHVHHVPLLRKKNNVFEVYVVNFVSFFKMTKSEGHEVEVVISSHATGGFSVGDILYMLGGEKREGVEPVDIATKIKRGVECLDEDSDKIISDFEKKYLLAFLPEGRDRKLKLFERCLGLLEDFSRGLCKASNLDSMENKQFLTAGSLMYILLESELWNQREWWVENQNNKKGCRTQPFYKLFQKRLQNFTDRMEQSFVTSSDWPRGIAHPVRLVKRLCSSIQLPCLLKNIKLPIHEDNRQVKTRLWHGSGYGFICPVTTPEGENIGTLKSLTSYAEISVYIDWNQVYEELREIIDEEKDGVYLNHVPIGGVVDPGKMDEVVYKIRKLKHEKYPKMGVVVRENNHIEVNCYEGRLIRPLFNTTMMAMYGEFEEEGQCGGMTFEEMVYLGYIEWLDVEEQSMAYIRYDSDTVAEHGEEDDYFSPEYTHQELHNGSLLSLEANMSECINHDQANRNLIAAGMTKQAVGSHAFQERWDKETMFSLMYPQKSVCMTDMTRWMGGEVLPTTTNMVCAIYTLPNNQDDAVVFNKRFIDLGGFMIKGERTFTYTVSQGHRLGLPSRCPMKITEKEWSQLTIGDGVIQVGSRVYQDTPFAVIVDARGEVVDVFRSRAVLNDHGIKDLDYRYTVEAVCLTQDRYENTRLAVKVSHIRRPKVGDKFASKSAQKCVIGEVKEPEDLPRNSEGMTADLYINPHCIPSRKTMGHLLSMLMGKCAMIAVKERHSLSSTPFKTTPVEEVMRILSEVGMVRGDGKETFYDGCTGRKIDDGVFMGVIPYQALSHFSSDKMMSACRASENPETRAPMKGKRNFGGVRVGEMEFSTFASYGVSEIHSERSLGSSDGISMQVCCGCGEFLGLERKECVYCGGRELEKTKRPYGLSRLNSTLKAAHISFDISGQSKKRHVISEEV